MAGLLDFLLGQQTGGGLLGLGGPQGAPPSMPPGAGFGTSYVNADTGGLLGRLRGGLNQIANPQALQDAYEQQRAQAAGMAMLGALPGGGQLPQQPSSMITPAAAAPANTAMPRGIRNNNPLNIEAGPFTQGQPGFAGSDGRFARFEKPEQGISAANSLLDIYQNKHGLNTVAGIIGRWAPAGENDTRGYVTSVAGRLGVDPNQPLNPEQRTALIAAMGQFENGRPIPMGGAGTQAMGFNGTPERPNAQGVYGADAVMMPPQQAPGQTAQMGGPAPMPGGPQGAPPPQALPTGRPALSQPGSGLQLIDSPALQGMPDTVRRAIPLMLASKQYQPQAMALIQKYINPDQWQLWRDSMGNVFTRNSASGESKPLLTPTPDMMNANASGLRSPLEYTTATKFGEAAAKNTETTGEQKNAAASGGLNPVQFTEAKQQAEERGKAAGQAQANLPSVIAMADQALKTINQIRNHPGRDAVASVGTLGWVPPIPGTPQKGFVTLLEQAKGQVFLKAYEGLKGGGAITEVEGIKATQALARLDRAQSSGDFNQALKDLEDVIATGKKVAEQKTRATEGGGWVDVSPGVRIREKR